MVRLRRPRQPLLIARKVVAALLATAALVLALRPAPAPAGPPAAVPVAVAATDLPPGAVLDAADLTVAYYPPVLRPGGVVEDPTALVGQVLAGGVRAGEPVTDAGLVGAGLTAQLDDRQVAAPVRPADLAVSALARPGTGSTSWRRRRVPGGLMSWPPGRSSSRRPALATPPRACCCWRWTPTPRHSSPPRPRPRP